MTRNRGLLNPDGGRLLHRLWQRDAPAKRKPTPGTVCPRRWPRACATTESVRGGRTPGDRRAASRRTVTRDVLDLLFSTCASDQLVDARDGAVLDTEHPDGEDGARATMVDPHVRAGDPMTAPPRPPGCAVGLTGPAAGSAARDAFAGLKRAAHITPNAALAGDARGFRP